MPIAIPCRPCDASGLVRTRTLGGGHHLEKCIYCGGAGEKTSATLGETVDDLSPVFE